VALIRVLEDDLGVVRNLGFEGVFIVVDLVLFNLLQFVFKLSIPVPLHRLLVVGVVKQARSILQHLLRLLVSKLDLAQTIIFFILLLDLSLDNLLVSQLLPAELLVGELLLSFLLELGLGFGEFGLHWVDLERMLLLLESSRRWLLVAQFLSVYIRNKVRVGSFLARLSRSRSTCHMEVRARL